MSARPWTPWYWSDHRGDPGVLALSYGARGLWQELVGLMADANPRGYLLVNGAPPNERALLKLTRGESLSELRRFLKEIKQNQVCSTTPEGVLFSRRLVRDAERSQRKRKDGGRYVPHPATWLNDRRWEDDVTLGAPARALPRVPLDVRELCEAAGVGRHDVETWFVGATMDRDSETGRVAIAVPEPAIRAWVIKHYGEALEATVIARGGSKLDIVADLSEAA